MAPEYKFQGWLGLDKNSIGNMQWATYEPKPFEEHDVDIQIMASGICGSDLHTLRSGWGPADYPCVVGHEIVGKVVRAGSKVERGIKVGDRVGVGAQSGSCLRPDCEGCGAAPQPLEQHCTRQVQTYNSKWPGGAKSYGGYGKYWRGHSHFVFKIPDAVPSAAAAPMLCGGVTVYSPLKHHGCGPGKTVGIVGVGGLGHFGLLFAKALGADKVVAISRGRSKEADARRLGADEFIATGEKGWMKQHARSLDLIVCTVGENDLPFEGYLRLLRLQGTYVQVGLPEKALPGLRAGSLIGKAIRVTGSAIGSPADIIEMLDLAAARNIQPMIQERPMSEANQAVVDMDKNLARYRYVLVNPPESKL